MKLIADVEMQWVNENSLLLNFGNRIDASLSKVIACFNNVISQSLQQYIIDAIPAYTSLLLIIDKNTIALERFEGLIEQALQSFCIEREKKEYFLNDYAKDVIIPVLYDVSVAPDLERMARSRGLSIDDIAQLHSAQSYNVFTIGFSPGFAYMGVVDLRIAEPRLATPRPFVAKGSVGIAGEQTGVYPSNSPGGWNIIGRTPQSMLWLNVSGVLQCPVAVGDRVRFQPMTIDEFQKYGEGLS